MVNIVKFMADLSRILNDARILEGGHAQSGGSDPSRPCLPIAIPADKAEKGRFQVMEPALATVAGATRSLCLRG